jgi:hypothetical protein
LWRCPSPIARSTSSTKSSRRSWTGWCPIPFQDEKLSGEFRPGGRRPDREELLSPACPKDEMQRFGSALWWRLLSGGAESPGTGRRWALRAARSGCITQIRGLMLVTKHRRDSGWRDPDQNGARSMSYVADCGGQSCALRRSRRHADRLYSRFGNRLAWNSWSTCPQRSTREGVDERPLG